jgi:hypothetical protein
MADVMMMTTHSLEAEVNDPKIGKYFLVYLWEKEDGMFVTQNETIIWQLRGKLNAFEDLPSFMQERVALLKAAYNPNDGSGTFIRGLGSIGSSGFPGGRFWLEIKLTPQERDAYHDWRVRE